MWNGHSSIKIVIAAGGTGGHLFPAQALAQDLLRRESRLEVIFMSPVLSTNPYFDKEQFQYRDITSATPFRRNPFKLIKSLFSLLKGSVQSLRILGGIKPILVIGFGSFHSFPVLLAARLRRTPIILFESNAAPGKVNRFCSRWAKFTAIHFQRVESVLKGKTVCVHMPLLKKNEGLCPQEAREYFKLDKDKLTFLIFGGSQGAQAINRYFCESLEKLIEKDFNFQVVHIVGDPDRADRLREIYSKYQIPATVKPFEDKMDFAWSAADLSISRAGAGTLAEQIEFSTPSIMIPYPHATENHQGKNASFVAEEVNGGVKVSEGELSADHLVSVIEDLLSSQKEKLNTMKKSLQDFKNSEEKKDFSSVIFDFINHGTYK